MSSEKMSVCEYVAASLRRDIETGIIEGGEKLPSCRELALQRGINPNTVQKAYSLLEKQGFIEVLPQKGAYAKKSPVAENRERQAEKQLRALKEGGITREKLIEIINIIYGEDDDRN